MPAPTNEPQPVDAPVHLEPYNPAWPQLYRIEAAAILDVIGPWVTGGIHHVGSTAVPGLHAKPVIDIMAGVADLNSSRPCIDLLAALSYCHARYRADTMHWFCKPSREHRTHHLHLVPTGSDRFRGALAFRDHLRRHAGDAARYEHLKQALAAQHPNDREAYTQGKSDLIAELTQTALRSAGPALTADAGERRDQS